MNVVAVSDQTFESFPESLNRSGFGGYHGRRWGRLLTDKKDCWQAQTDGDSRLNRNEKVEILLSFSDWGATISFLNFIIIIEYNQDKYLTDKDTKRSRYNTYRSCKTALFVSEPVRC
jgi:hypothetical protein